MNIFTSLRGFFSKSVAAMTIVATVGMFAQPAFTAYADTAGSDPVVGGPTLTIPCTTYNYVIATSDTNVAFADASGGGNAVEVSPLTTATWPQISNGSQWIWTEDPITADPSVDDTATFTKTFTANGNFWASGMEVAVAPGSTINATLNGHNLGSGTFIAKTTADYSAFDVTSSLVDGANTLVITVTRPGDASLTSTSSPTLNPAGVAFEVTANSCPPVSTTAPTITVNGANPLDLNIGDTFTDPGATATATASGDVLSAVTVTGGTDGNGNVDTTAATSTTLIYSVTDTTNGLSASTTRQVVVSSSGSGKSSPGGVPPAPVASTTPPTITLNGSSTIDLALYDPFMDPGATATTSVPGDVLSPIVETGGNGSTTGTIDTTMATDAVLVYTVTDTTNGLSASTTLTVHISRLTAPGGGTPTPVTSSSTLPAYVCSASSTETTYYSDSSTMVGTSPAVEETYINPGWTASIPGASWIWNTDGVTDPTANQTVSFDKMVSILGTTTAAKVDIAADNTYTVALNGTTIGNDSTGGTFANQQEYSINPALFTQGSNDFGFTVTNLGVPGSTAQSNPAGLLYSVTVCSDPVAPPTIAINGFSPFIVTVGTTFTDPGAVASSTESGDLTSDIVVTGGNAVPAPDISTASIGTTSLTYTVTDPATGLSASTTRLVYITDPGAGASSTVSGPVIALNGANPFVIAQGDTFVDPGATASDTESGDLTSDIIVTGGNGTATGTIDTSAIGTTSLIYTVTDATTTLSASTSREVDIVAATSTNSGGGSGPLAPLVLFASGGGGGGGGGGIGLGTDASTTTISGALSCPFMTGYVVPGRIVNILSGTSVNDPAQIEKLQVFLNAYEGDNAVTVTGVLDSATISGILAFQQKYLTQTMGPWGAHSPSGNVYITTLREINAIVCGPQPSLTPAQQAVINAYLATTAGNNNGGTRGGNTPANTPNVVTPPLTNNEGTTTGSTGSTGTTTSTTTNTTAGPNNNNAALTGSVVSSGAGSTIGSFFSKIFGFLHI
jgi:hypothetical protein